MNPSPLNNSESLFNQESTKPTDDIYANFTDATNMDEYNDKIYTEQLARVQANREKVEKDAKERVLSYNRLAKKLKEKETADINRRNTDGWSFFKDDEFWKYYFETVNKTGYTESDNYLDNLKEDRYFPIKISDEYQQIGSFEETPLGKANYKSNYEIYQGPKREYIYDRTSRVSLQSAFPCYASCCHRTSPNGSSNSFKMGGTHRYAANHAHSRRAKTILRFFLRRWNGNAGNRSILYRTWSKKSVRNTKNIR